MFCIFLFYWVSARLWCSRRFVVLIFSWTAVRVVNSTKLQPDHRLPVDLFRFVTGLSCVAILQNKRGARQMVKELSSSSTTVRVPVWVPDYGSQLPGCLKSPNQSLYSDEVRLLFSLYLYIMITILMMLMEMMMTESIIIIIYLCFNWIIWLSFNFFITSLKLLFFLPYSLNYSRSLCWMEQMKQ